MKYFSISELTRSSKATELKIDNTPPPSAVKSMEILIDRLLDPIREKWGSPITVTSGYRCKALNRAVGGAASSHHLIGMAVDITAGDQRRNARLYHLIRTAGFPFTQLIWEKGDDSGPQWIHVSFNPADLRNETRRIR